MESPDCFLHQITSYLSGDSGTVIKAASGNMRMTNCKSWFTGMQSAAECVGAGIHIPDPGTLALEMVGVSIQDSWGPGLSIEGDTGIHFSGDLDEADGGRVTEQGFGYAGARTLPRCYIRLPGTLRRGEINARIRGGGRNGAANRPHLVDLRGSGVMGCRLDLNGDLTNMDATPVVTSAGHDNADRYNEVRFAGRLLHGQVTQAQLDDPAHGVNDPLYGPTQVTRDDGVMMIRAAAGWLAQRPPDPQVMTRAEYDALAAPDPDTLYLITG